MDEYYCPNCGATINDQYGFDPSCGTWTCTVCGKLLMDDDVYEGDSYEGVAWYCDNCGALLNRQTGFSDIYDSWVCTECGHRNGITENDILDEDDDSSKCPNCGANLKEQFCYADYLDDWECTECGVHLHHDYSSAPYDVVDDESEVEDCEEDETFEEYYEKDVDCETTYSSSSGNLNFQKEDTDTSYSYKEHKISEGELRKKRIKAFLFRKKKVEIGYDCTELLRKNIATVQTALHNKAFNNIKIISVKDIYIGSHYKEGEVEQIVIGGNSFFTAADMFPYDTEIIITYHEKKEIQIPFSSNLLRKKNLVEVKSWLLELGFTKIEERPIRDLITGWINKAGSIERVYLDGDSNFKRNTFYKYDINIIIEYHTFRK